MDPAMAEAFRQIPYGIYVLIAQKGKDLHALIVSWVSQVSYSPPMLMVALRLNRKALPALRETGLFSLSLFKKDQKPLVARFKESPPEAEPSIYAGEGGPDLPPILKGCLRLLAMPPGFDNGSRGSHPLSGRGDVGLRNPGGGAPDNARIRKNIHRPILKGIL